MYILYTYIIYLFNDKSSQHNYIIFQILGRTVRVDHCEQYKVPNADTSKLDDVTAAIRFDGCAPTLQIDTVATPAIATVKQASDFEKYNT